MTDDLLMTVCDFVKRLRDFVPARHTNSETVYLVDEAADRIEELHQLMRIRTSQYNSCCRDKAAADARIEELEKALIWIIENDYNLNLTIDAKKKVAIDVLRKNKND